MKVKFLQHDFLGQILIIRQGGAILIDNLKIDNTKTILNFSLSGEAVASAAEFKISLNSYLRDLIVSPVRSLADVIAFNKKNSKLVSTSQSQYIS